MSPSVCTTAEIGPFAGVAVVCLAFQSCENNYVCTVSPLSRWSVISGPSDRVARSECVEQRHIWVRGTPLAGTHKFDADGGCHDKPNSTQSSVQLGSFTHTYVEPVIQECPVRGARDALETNIVQLIPTVNIQW